LRRENPEKSDMQLKNERTKEILVAKTLERCGKKKAYAAKVLDSY